jgi:hypothetical protein
MRSSESPAARQERGVTTSYLAARLQVHSVRDLPPFPSRIAAPGSAPGQIAVPVAEGLGRET